MDKPYSEACERNKAPILAQLRALYADVGTLLEVGSGTGQHAVHFAAALPQLLWQCSDIAANLPGIRLWLDEARLPNLPPPLTLDVDQPWPPGRYDAVYTANTLHIMGWPQVRALFAGLPQVLRPQGLFTAYGPFNRGGQFTSDSNQRFDASLRAGDAARGIRDFEAVDALARAAGLRLMAEVAMPANNFLLTWRQCAPNPVG
jgi:cyclopropane fatty-acyl-phospholipid synthase-like methyltransferase